jgi:hypothetical protein
MSTTTLGTAPVPATAVPRHPSPKHSPGSDSRALGQGSVVHVSPELGLLEEPVRFGGRAAPSLRVGDMQRLNGGHSVVVRGTTEPGAIVEVRNTELFRAWKSGTPGAWDGHDNGRIPVSELCGVPFAPGEELRCDAVAGLVQLNHAYKRAFGTNLRVIDSYRSYADQVAVKASRGFFAAVPGYSNHGWALAVDLSGSAAAPGSAQHAWLLAHGRRYGWHLPGWAQPDGRKPEPWHWEFVGVPRPGSVVVARVRADQDGDWAARVDGLAPGNSNLPVSAKVGGRVVARAHAEVRRD